MSRGLVVSLRSHPILATTSGLIMSWWFFKRWVDFSKEKAVFCRCQPRLKDKVVVITGATSGIGYQVALECAKREAVVHFGARDLTKGEKVKKKLQAKSNNPNVFCHHLDLNDLDSCKKFAESITQKVPNISFLINNAGIFNQTPKLTNDGFESTWQTNYLGSVVVTENLLDCMGFGVDGDAAIIFVNSQARFCATINDVQHARMEVLLKFSSFEEIIKHYGLTKKALWIYATYLAYSKGNSSYRVLSVDPGSVWSNIYKGSWWGSIKGLYTRWKCSLLMRTPSEGAQTILHCMQAPLLTNGSLMKDCETAEVPSKETLEYCPSFVAQTHKLVEKFIPNQGVDVKIQNLNLKVVKACVHDIIYEEGDFN